MDLRHALRSTSAVRDFQPRPVEESAIRRVLDTARFAPSGGNRQGWRVIDVRDPERRRAIRDAYLDAWVEYLAHLRAGVTPFSPLLTSEEHAAVVAHHAEARASIGPDDFPVRLDAVPALLVVCARLGSMAATDQDLDRYHFIGGASVYPFVWSILLAAREEGLAGVMTTVAVAREPALRAILHIPDGFAIAAVVALGHPQHELTRLRRREVDNFATRDSFDGPPLGP